MNAGKENIPNYVGKKAEENYYSGETEIDLIVEIPSEVLRESEQVQRETEPLDEISLLHRRAQRQPWVILPSETEFSADDDPEVAKAQKQAGRG